MAEKNFFNDLEALKMAVNIEKRGGRFYKMAAQKMEGEPDIIEIFLDLARQEEEHAETFQQLHDDFVRRKHDFDDSYLYEPEVEAYLRAMAETFIFPTNEEQDAMLEKIQSVDDVIRLGMQAEKDSILFYTEMIIYSKLTEAKTAFRRLLKEEKKHLLDLKDKLSAN